MERGVENREVGRVSLFSFYTFLTEVSYLSICFISLPDLKCSGVHVCVVAFIQVAPENEGVALEVLNILYINLHISHLNLSCFLGPPGPKPVRGFCRQEYFHFLLVSSLIDLWGYNFSYFARFSFCLLSSKNLWKFPKSFLTFPTYIPMSLHLLKMTSLSFYWGLREKARRTCMAN